MNKGLIEIHNACISKNLPFVTFRLPQQEHSTTYIQTTPGNVEWESHPGYYPGRPALSWPPSIPGTDILYILVKPDLVIEETEITRQTISQVEALESRPQPHWNGNAPVVTGQGDIYGAGRCH